MKENMATDKLYLICTKVPLQELAKNVFFDSFSAVQELAYISFWDNLSILEYNRNTKVYTLKEFGVTGIAHSYATFGSESALFRYMDQFGINFIGDENVLGDIFASYAAAYLEIVRWSADVAYSKKFYNELLEDW